MSINLQYSYRDNRCTIHCKAQYDNLMWNDLNKTNRVIVLNEATGSE